MSVIGCPFIPSADDIGRPLCVDFISRKPATGSIACTLDLRTAGGSLVLAGEPLTQYSPTIWQATVHGLVLVAGQKYQAEVAYDDSAAPFDWPKDISIIAYINAGA